MGVDILKDLMADVCRQFRVKTGDPLQKFCCAVGGTNNDGLDCMVAVQVNRSRYIWNILEESLLLD